MEKLLILFIPVIIATNLFAQDIIFLKTGDEINSKVLEVSTDVIKYKKWENQNGPIYSTNKSEIFMIKYINGTKDVFNITPANDSSPRQSDAYVNKFIGNWFPKGYDGNNNKTMLVISRAGEGFLVEYRVMQREGGFDFMYGTSGSFKEVGRIEGGSIIINSFTKLSLISDNTLLMNSKEFRKPVQQKNQTQPQQTRQQNSNSEKQPAKKSPDITIKNSRTPLLNLESK